MENFPMLWNLPLPVWGGIFALIVLLYQALTGLRIIKVSPKTHKLFGLILVGMALIHGILGLSLYL